MYKLFKNAKSTKFNALQNFYLYGTYCGLGGHKKYMHNWWLHGPKINVSAILVQGELVYLAFQSYLGIQLLHLHYVHSYWHQYHYADSQTMIPLYPCTEDYQTIFAHCLDHSKLFHDIVLLLHILVVYTPQWHHCYRKGHHTLSPTVHCSILLHALHLVDHH